jgi:uncharacterized protein YjbI with pentapeptide repeats
MVAEKARIDNQRINGYSDFGYMTVGEAEERPKRMPLDGVLAADLAVRIKKLGLSDKVPASLENHYDERQSFYQADEDEPYQADAAEMWQTEKENYVLQQHLVENRGIHSKFTKIEINFNHPKCLEYLKALEERFNKNEAQPVGERERIRVNFCGKLTPESPEAELFLKLACAKDAERKPLNFFEASSFRVFDPKTKKYKPADLSGVDLHKAQLPCANLSGAILNKTNLTKANLKGANLYQASAQRALFSGANLAYACLDKIKAAAVKLRGGKVLQTQFYGTNLNFAQAREAELGEANLTNATIKKTNFSFSDLANACFNLLLPGQREAANFTGAKTKGATFTVCDPDALLTQETDQGLEKGSSSQSQEAPWYANENAKNMQEAVPSR